MKRILLITFTIILLVSLSACSKNNNPTSNSKINSTTQEFTLEELKKYNGKSGNPSYVAVNGKVYDVSKSPLWKNGEHNGLKAGNDLTKEIMQASPHGDSVLKSFPVVGVLKK